MWLYIVWLLPFLYMVQSRSGGAPCGSYLSMIPNHGRISAPRGSANAFEINGDDNGRGEYSVIITARTRLAGLVVQGRSANQFDSGPIGSFADDPHTMRNFCLQFQNCNGETRRSITHNTPNCNSRATCSEQNPCTIQLRWIPPSGHNGNIVFTMTGLSGYSEGVVKIRSNSISIRSSQSGGSPPSARPNRVRVPNGQRQQVLDRNDPIEVRENPTFHGNGCAFTDIWIDWCYTIGNCDHFDSQCCTDQFIRQHCAQRCCALEKAAKRG